MTSPDVDETILVPTRAFDYAQKVVQFIEESALSLLVDLPPSRYITTGEPVYDCEQLVVAIVSLQTGLPDGSSQSSVPQAVDCMSPWSLVMDVGLVRCGPAMNKSGTIAHTALSGAARIESVDSDVLMDALNNGIVQDSFSAVRAAITYGAYEGGFIATTMRLTTVLP